MTTRAIEERRQARSQYFENVRSLGWAHTVRYDSRYFELLAIYTIFSVGHGLSETWEEGEAFQSLRRREEELNVRRKQIDDEKKMLSRLKPKSTKPVCKCFGNGYLG